ncbi:hypothetical protein Taro_028303, partial [Colocasia esculenta]|nr:hypothetical protein [Colocasia esculenta]
MQAKIEAFFKPSAPRKPIYPPPGGAALVEAEVELPVAAESPGLDAAITYQRRRDHLDQRGSCDDAKEIDNKPPEVANNLSVNPAKVSSIGKVLNKKRSYAQYYLEFGQSDFLLHTCSICGMRYARGDEDDEKVHKTFHNNYYHGIPFKGWRSERVISTDKDTGDRIILVLDGDPPAHKHKVLEVVKLLEGELGLSDGWLLHKLCKVYLFVSNNRIVGSMFAEPIRQAYRVISNSRFLSDSNRKETTEPTSCTSSSADAESTGPDRSLLQFGDIRFRREAMKRIPSNGGHKVNAFDSGAIFRDEEPVPARCGIRAIWVVPSKRRQGIATKLLDSVRKDFGPDYLIEATRCAFSQPTSAGKAFATTYSCTDTFLVYRAEDS